MAAPRGTLVEIAVALPLAQTFTYRDPRAGQPLPMGTQVVVPFGGRTVTGFVVGHPAEPPAGDGPIKAIEAVVDHDDPPLDAQVLRFCRWTATYYAAPLGEVLRAALPSGERAKAERRVRLSDEGARLVERRSTGRDLRALALRPDEAALLVRLAKVGTLSLRALARAGGAPAGDKSTDGKMVDRLIAEGLVEVGDQIQGAVGARKEMFAIAVDTTAPPESGTAAVKTRGTRGSTEPGARAPARTALLTTLRAAGATGVALASLAPRERALLRALVAAGGARVDARAPAPRAKDASPVVGLPMLNLHQQAAFDEMRAALSSGFAPFLLHGITGSGKTEVYLRVIAEARAAGNGALVLVPEIALTPQLAQRFRQRFGDDVAVLHSALAPARRREAWRRLRAGEVGIALGARSAVFAPVQRLGVVVVDEEHDPSFKQEEGLRYQGRDLAIVRAQQAQALVVVGSATPSLESFVNAERGRYRRLLLPTRATPAAALRPLPTVETIDLRKHRLGPDGLFAPGLAIAVDETLARGEQVILFLNRRGFSTLALCRACGHVVECRDCSVSMTYHRGVGRLVCHYCARTEPVPPRCPACRLPKIELLGVGTERVEAVVRERFPSARVARMDRDTAGRGQSLEALLAAVHAREVDILVGTQMVTKGHDFPGVTLVGVLQADQGMHLPDFRAAERTFQLLEQVAGRAGRAEHPGRVIVQTYTPDHPALLALATHDYDGFARRELGDRQKFGYPPFTRMIALRIEGPDEASVRAVAHEAAERARRAGGDDLVVRGPAEAPLARLRGLSRWQAWLASLGRAPLAAAGQAALATTLPRGTRLVVDVDPQSVL